MEKPERFREAPWVRQVSRLGDVELRQNLERLSAVEQARVVLALDWQDRLRLVVNSDKAREVIAALPEEEVFLTIKALGEEEALPILALTTPDQLRFVLDVELWSKDLIDPDKAVLWLHHILACGEEKVIEFVTKADLELVVVVLKRLLCLVPNEEGVVVPEGLPNIMPDEYFTILSSFPEETEAIRLFLRIVRQADRDLFYTLLFLVYGSMDEEAEEAALRWRNSRLEEAGLLDFDEAVEIYGYIDEAESRSLAGASARAYTPSEDAEPVAPGFPTLMVQRRTFFYEVLTSIEDEGLANRLRREIAFSATRLLVADAEHIGDLEAMRKALDRLFSLVNVGLLSLSGEDRNRARLVLRTVPIRDVFQVGFSRTVDLRRAALSIAQRYWPEWKTAGFTFLGTPADEVMRGLVMRVPQHYEFKAGAVFRDFETLGEIESARAHLEEAGVLAETCFEKLGVPKPGEAAPSLAGVFALDLADITLENLLLTALVNVGLGRELRVSPLSRGDVREVFERVLEKDANGRNVVGRASRDRMMAALRQATGFEEGRFQALSRAVERSLRTLEDEVGSIAAWEDVDPRYVRSLIFKRSEADRERVNRGSGHE